MKNLSSPSQDYDALVIVATELDQIKDHVDSAITKDLQAFSEVSERDFLQRSFSGWNSISVE